MKNKLISMIPYIFINIGLVLFSRFLITDTGLGIFMFIYFLPLVVFISGLIYGKRNGFCIIFPILILGILFPIFWTIYDPSAGFYSFLYGGLALIGNTIGFIFYKKSKVSDFTKVILAVLLGILMIGFVIFVFKSLHISVNKPVISENSVQFEVVNLTENQLTDISIKANEETCGVNNIAGKLDREEAVKLYLDFSSKKDCNPPKSDGNFIITYFVNGEKKESNFGYYTNGILVGKFYEIQINKNGEISVKEK